jgi:integration host factor subunit beta
VVQSQLVRLLSDKLPELQASDVELAVNCILEQMYSAFESGKRIEIRGFGSFDLHHHAPRIRRNPKTGETLVVPARVAIHFKPGKEMRDRVNDARGKCRITK